MDRTEGWTFLSNHGHVLVALARDPAVRIRDIAVQVGITERAVQLIVHDLNQAGYVTVERIGRRNHYSVDNNLPLRHDLERHTRIGDLLAVLETPASR